MAKNSNAKGKSGELQLAAILRDTFGCAARRGQQYSGTPDSPDVVTSIPGVHWECKRTERLRLYDAIQQADEDRGVGEVPVVAHRQNRREWVAIVRLQDLPELARAICKATAPPAPGGCVDD